MIESSSFIQELFNLPKLTIKDFYNKDKTNKISKTAVSSPLYQEPHNRKGSCIDVKEPFYIDRYLKGNHRLKDGFCYACEYGKLHGINFKHKAPFFQNTNTKTKKNAHLRHKTQNVEKFCFFDREYFQNSEVGSVTINFLLNFVKDKMNEVTQTVQEKFQNGTGFNLKSDKVIGACLEYFMINEGNCEIETTKQQLKKLSDDNANKNTMIDDEQIKNKLSDNKKPIKSDFETVLKEIHEVNMNNLVLEEKFLKFHKNHNENYETTLKNLLKLEKKNFQSKNPVSKENILSVSKEKLEGKKKKGKFLSSQNSSSGYESKANSIYTELMIDLSEHGENSLGAEIQDRLNDFSTSPYREFQQIFNVFENKMMLHLNEKNKKQTKMIRKLETASIFMKNCVNEDDIFYFQKHQRIERSLSNFKRESRNTQKSKTSLGHIHSSSKIQSIISIDTNNNSKRTISEQKISKKSEISSSNGTKKKQMIRKSKKHEEKEYQEYEQEKDENDLKGKNNSNGEIEIRIFTQNKIPNEELQVPEKKFEKPKLERKVSSLNKTNMSKYTKSEQISEEQIEPNNQSQEKIQIIEKISEEKTTKTISEKIKNEKQKEIIKIKTLEKIEEIEYIEETIYQKHKNILKLKANQLLRKNENIIEECENLLQELNLHEYIIKNDDCVFNQKKKIRILKDIIHQNYHHHHYEKHILDQIVEYLLVYQENCNILIETNETERNLNKYKEEENNTIQDLIARKDYYNDLYFYNLNEQYSYGGAEDNDIFFAEKANESIVEKHQKGKKIVHRMDLDKIFDIMKEPILIKPDIKNNRNISDCLIQVPLETKLEFQFINKRKIRSIKNKIEEKQIKNNNSSNNSNNNSPNNSPNNSHNNNYNNSHNSNNKCNINHNITNNNEINRLIANRKEERNLKKDNRKELRKFRKSCETENHKYQIQT